MMYYVAKMYTNTRFMVTVSRLIIN
jgi:hypothetical protein